MKLKMKINLKRVVVMVTLIIGLCLAGLASELPTLEVQQAAQKGLELYVNSSKPATKHIQKISSLTSRTSASVLGEGFPVYRVNEERLLCNGESFRYTTEAVGTWRFLVASKNKAASLITVAKMDNQWVMVKLGGAGIAAKMQKIIETWPREDGYEFRFIRIYSAAQDLVEISLDDVVLGYISLSPVAGVKVSEETPFNSMLLLEESDFRGPLTDTVERARTEFRMHNQPDSPVPAQPDQQDHRELSSVNSGITMQYHNLPALEQQYSNWCWNGCVTAILMFYDIAYLSQEITMPDGSTHTQVLIPMHQCFIAGWAWNDAGYGYSGICSDSDFYTGEGWNRANNHNPSNNGSTAQILNNWNVTTTYKTSELSYSSLKTELDAGHPFIMSWGWLDSSGQVTGGHALVGIGYLDDPAQDFVIYHDPWIGEGHQMALYNYVKSSSDHYWRKTLKTSY